MAYRPPEVFHVLYDLELGNDNVHRLQIVRYAQHRNAVIGLECREFVHPTNIGRHDPPLRRFDARGWGHGFVKMLRPEHVEWILENGDLIQSLIARYRIQILEDGLDGWRRKSS